MSVLSKFFGSRDDVPEWAKFMAPDEYREFITALVSDLQRRGTPFEMGDGVVSVARGAAEPQEYGLQNLAQMCRQCARPEWPAVITRHFDTLFEIDREQKELDTLADDFERVRSKLKVRLYPADMQGLDFVVRREPADGIVAVLVFDLPKTVATVHPETAKKWSRPADDLYAIALDNVRAEGRLQKQSTPVEGGAAVWSLVGDSFFSASHVLFLREYMDAAPARGAIVGVPNRHTVLFHPIEDLRAVAAIQSMLVATFGMYHEGPGAVSPILYWWRDGGLTALPSRVRANSIDFTPPETFVEMLNGLAAP